MHKTQAGFTLVELVVVIVLLGILGVTALGKFQDLSSQAADASEQGIASELSSAAAINYAANVVGANSTTIAAADCISAGTAPSTSLDALMASGSAPTVNLAYAITANGDITAEGLPCAAGETFNCAITHADGTGTDGEAAIICTGP